MEQTWDSCCRDSIRKEKMEVEKRYEIRIGQTDIYCTKCSKPWGFGNHTCIKRCLNKKSP